MPGWRSQPECRQHSARERLCFCGHDGKHLSAYLLKLCWPPCNCGEWNSHDSSSTTPQTLFCPSCCTLEQVRLSPSDELKPRVFTGELHPCDPFLMTRAASVQVWTNSIETNKRICLFCSSRKVIILDFLLQKINRKIGHQLFFQTLLWCSVRYWQLNTESTTLGSVEQSLFYFSFWSIESSQLWRWVIAHALI